MSSPFPNPVPNQPWGRLWMTVEAWRQRPWLEQGFYGPALPSEGCAFFLNANLGNGADLPGPLQQWLADPDTRAWVLLARPQAGKTFELKRLAEELGDRACLIDAKEIGEPLPQHLDRKFAVLNPQSEPFTLIFDSLDESQLREANTLTVLTGWLKDYDRKHGTRNLRLVMSCRWADWPEGKLREAVLEWSGHSPCTLALLPVSELDARATAEKLLGSDEVISFWNELRTRQLGWLACWPRAFVSMLRVFHGNGALPDSPRALLQEHVESLLCLSNDPDETTRYEHNADDSKWMTRVAGRMAAALFFGRAHGVDFTSDHVVEGTLAARELSGEEKWLMGLRSVTDADLNAVRQKSALLRRLPESHVAVFDSQPVQEQLAARWLIDQALSPEKLRDLFAAGVGTDLPPVLPPLRPLAAAVAEENPAFRQWLIENDPVVLLHADHSMLSAENKAEVVAALLNYTDRVGTMDSDAWQAHFSTLGHSGLLGQLQPWLENQADHSAAALLALHIGRHARPAGLAELLWRIFPHWERRHRPELARVIGEVTADVPPEDWQGRWREVIDGTHPTDGDGVLIGTALERMVPRFMPARDAAKWLIQERRFDVIGRFTFFLWSAGQHVMPDDVPPILALMEKEQVFCNRRGEEGDPFHRKTWVPFRVLQLAFENLSQPGVRRALDSYWIASVNHCGLHLNDPAQWREGFGLTDDVRRDFAKSLLSRIQVKVEALRFGGEKRFLLESGRDAEWMLEELRVAQDRWRTHLTEICKQFFWRDDFRAAHAGPLRRLWQTVPELQIAVPPGDEGEDPLERIDRLRREESDRLAADNATFEAEMAARTAALEKALANNERQIQAAHDTGGIIWAEAYGWMLMRQQGRAGGIVSHRFATEYKPEETWVPEAARRFLLNQEPAPELGFLAQLALTCLGEAALRDPEIQKRISAQWLPWLVDSSVDDHPAWLPRQKAWLELYPEREKEVFSAIVRHRYARQDDMLFLPGWDRRWQPMHTECLARVLAEETFQPAGAGPAWLALREHDPDAAWLILEQWLDRVLGPDGEKEFDAGQEPKPANSNHGWRSSANEPVPTEPALVLGLAFVCAQGRFWSRLEASFVGQVATVRSVMGVIESLLTRFGFSNEGWFDQTQQSFDQWVSDTALVAFVECVWRAFPRQGEPAEFFSLYAHTTTWEDHVEQLRSAAQIAAEKRGLIINPPTAAIAVSLDEARRWREQGNRIALSARRHERMLQWSPLKPSELFRYCWEPEVRLARTTDELMSAIHRALDRWEAQGKTYVRDPRTSKLHKELTISKRLTSWLIEHTQVVGAAEPQPFHETGERLDIFLQWPVPAWQTTLKVVIEVKKSDHRDVSKSMETQLLQKYLQPMSQTDTAITHGMYLVIFVKGDDSSLEKLRASLEQQASALSQQSGFSFSARVMDAR